MQGNRVKLLAFVAVLLFVAGLLAGYLVPRLAFHNSSARSYNTSTIIRQVRTLSQLVTVQYVMEKVVILEVPPGSVLGQMFAGNNRILLLAHGVVKAGVDLSQIQDGDVQIENNVVRIKLPKARITDAYLDEKQTQVIEWTTGLFRSFDKDLEQSARQDALDDIRRAARLSGITGDADQRARDQIKALLEPMGLRAEFAGT